MRVHSTARRPSRRPCALLSPLALPPLLGLAFAPAACAGPRGADRALPLAPRAEEARPAAPPWPTGDVHDFDDFAGGWVTRQRRLKARGTGSDEWEEFPGTLCMKPDLGGMATVDELVFPTKGWSGLTLRAFDVQKRHWSVYWLSSRTGTLGTPVVGGFEGDRGTFYGDDEDGGRPVKVRHAWAKRDQDHAHWEQAFSHDGQTWEVNWTAEFVRADPASVCAEGCPRT